MWTETAASGGSSLEAVLALSAMIAESMCKPSGGVFDAFSYGGLIPSEGPTLGGGLPREIGA